MGNHFPFFAILGLAWIAITFGFHLPTLIALLGWVVYGAWLVFIVLTKEGSDA